jgi:hypothetical protein
MPSLQMATSVAGDQLLQHRVPIATSIATYIISSGMSVFGVTIQ